MRKELVEYAKTVYMDTPLDEIKNHVQNMDEFRYVFNEAMKRGCKNPEVSPFSDDKEVIIPNDLVDKAREMFKGENLDTIKTSAVQKGLKCSYSIAWRIKDLLKNEKNLQKGN